MVDASPDAASLYPGYGLWGALADGSKFEFIACKQARTVVRFVGACLHANGMVFFRGFHCSHSAKVVH